MMEAKIVEEKMAQRPQSLIINIVPNDFYLALS